MLHNRLAKLREERANGEHGFTLIELLVVVVIIGILIAIAIPLYLNYKKGAADKATQSDVRNAVSVLEQCNSNSTASSYPAALGTLSTTGGNAYTAMTGCGGRINLSSNTVVSNAASAAAGLTYTPLPASCDASATPCTSYTLAGASGSAGNNKTFTYSSGSGQTVAS